MSFVELKIHLINNSEENKQLKDLGIEVEENEEFKEAVMRVRKEHVSNYRTNISKQDEPDGCYVYLLSGDNLWVNHTMSELIELIEK